MSKHFDLETFTFNGHTLRTVLLDGEPWFSAIDAMSCLGLRTGSGATNIVRALDPAEVRREAHITPQTLRGNPRIILVSESGLYKVIMRAQRSNPAAKDFQDWVTKEVLPRIRKNGGYIKDEEKVATGEVSPEQISANLWKFFAAKIAELDAVAVPLRRDAADLNAAQTWEEISLRTARSKTDRRTHEGRQC